MQIFGFNKTTLLDYPEHVAATVFAGGCNFRCPYCHNSDLVLAPTVEAPYSEEEVLSHLAKRKSVLQGVCITGGEPTLQKDLAEFIKKIKEMGYLVKLDTNGYHPEILWNLLSEKLIDAAAMDIKASKENYANATGIKNIDLSRIEESVAILKQSEIQYEFRTTAVKGIHKVEEFESIGKWLQGSRAYYIQNYKDNDKVIRNVKNSLGANEGKLDGFCLSELEKMLEKVQPYITNVALRGID